MIQVPWLGLTPRLPAIVGSDTTAMVVSRTGMKVPSDSANATTPRSRGGSCICALPSAPSTTLNPGHRNSRR